jgi:hypothetical protein
MLPISALRQIVKLQRIELESFEYGVEREKLKDIAPETSYAVIISGIRRCGKSTILRQFISKAGRFYYLNFEDTRLSDFSAGDFENLNKIFIEEYGPGGTYLFDEIQNVAKWELFIRSGLDRGALFVITGSNASLLSRELGTRLTGRHRDVELFPFSFSESLTARKEAASAESLRTYLVNGGFPQYLLRGRQETLRELLSDIIQRDIVSRYGLRNSKTLNDLALYLMTNVGKEFSFNKLRRMFNAGSVNTIISFISHLEDSYLVFSIKRFDYSVKKQLINPRKVYAIDNGLVSANTLSFSSDYGRMLENAVFIAIRRQHKDVFYFKGNGECDFIIREKGKIVSAIQVTYELGGENMAREVGGLSEAMKKFGLDHGTIVTMDQEDLIDIKGKKIHVVPAWKWLQANKY